MNFPVALRGSVTLHDRIERDDASMSFCKGFVVPRIIFNPSSFLGFQIPVYRLSLSLAPWLKCPWEKDDRAGGKAGVGAK